MTKKEIVRQLNEMKNTGIGGVEIQVLYPVAADDREKGIYNIPYFSPEFFEVIKETIREAEKLHMTVDFTPGSSWPFGGPFIPKEFAPEEAVIVQIDVQGPCSFSYDFTGRVNGSIQGLTIGKMEDGKMLPDTIKDLRKNLKEKLLYGWHWGEMLEEIEIPEGLHKITVLVVQNYRQSLGIPGRDAGGYAMDHMRNEVTDFFFENGVKPIVDYVGEGKIRGFFCDSIELAGNNWTPRFFEEFKRRRGYDLTLWFYGLWGKIGEAAEDVRYDYYRTMSELTIENFFMEMTRCCHQLGSVSRIQAHGTWGDILKAYGSADIPEGESFGEQDCYQVNSIHRKFASSAAHIYGKKIVSNESFTWLRMPRFLETLENMKAAADAIFLDGMNLIVNHGYAYAPEEENRGWPFYASSNLNDHEYYWKYYGELSGYIQRVSALMQKGIHCCEVGVYLPQADVWAENPIANLHMAMKLQEYMGWGTADEIQRQGYYFDYLNDEAVTSLGKMKEGLQIQGNKYHVILLPWCKRLPLATAQALEEFVLGGGILAAIGEIPSKSCGLLNQQDAKKITGIMSSLFPEETGFVKKNGRGKALWVSNVEELEICLGKEWTADVKVKRGRDKVGYIHRREGKNDFYFLAHIWEEEEEIEIIFRRGMEGMEIWDAMTGEEIKYRMCGEEGGESYLKLFMKPYQSIFVLFDFEKSKELADSIEELERREECKCEWKLSIPDKNFQKVQKEADFWTVYPELAYYSGEGIYSAQWKWDPDQRDKISEIWLHFEKIREIGEIYLNGEFCGVIWKRPYCIRVDGKIKQGENRLEVHVKNSGINEARDPKNTCFLYPGKVMEGWPYFTEVINQIRRKRIDCYREREMVKKPVDSGIQGKIFITYKLVRETDDFLEMQRRKTK